MVLQKQKHEALKTSITKHRCKRQTISSNLIFKSVLRKTLFCGDSAPTLSKTLYFPQVIGNTSVNLIVMLRRKRLKTPEARKRFKTSVVVVFGFQ